MAVLELGRRPDLLQLLITPDSPFRTVLQSAPAEPFVDAPILRFEVAGDPESSEPVTTLDWPSTLTLPNEATWSVTASDVNTLLASASSTYVRLMYGDQLWADGHYELADSQ